MAATEVITTFETKVLSFFGGVDFAFLFRHFRWPLFMVLLLILALSHAPKGSIGRAGEWLRGGWWSSQRPVFRGEAGPRSWLWLHPEEIVLILVVTALAVVGAITFYGRYRQSFADYGLRYLALESCLGRHDRVAARAKDLQVSNLWRRYRFEIGGAALRAEQMAEWQSAYEWQFRVAERSMTVSEARMRTLERAVLFGLDARERARLEGLFGPEVLDLLKKHKFDPDCGLGSE